MGDRSDWCASFCRRKLKMGKMERKPSFVARRNAYENKPDLRSSSRCIYRNILYIFKNVDKTISRIRTKTDANQGSLKILKLITGEI